MNEYIEMVNKKIQNEISKFDSWWIHLQFRWESNFLNLKNFQVFYMTLRVKNILSRKKIFPEKFFFSFQIKNYRV